MNNLKKHTVFVTQSAEETGHMGETFLKDLDRNILTLNGELGAGKTTFVQGLAKGLGILRRISSPTFIIMRTYEVPKSINIPFAKFYHVDLYRMETMHDIEGLGILELMKDPANLFAIEWAEKLENNLPTERIDIHIEYKSENERKIGVTYEN